MDVDALLASRNRFRALARRNADPSLRRRRLSRLLPDQLAGHAHVYRCHHPRLGAEHLGVEDHAGFPEHHARRPCGWLPRYHRRIVDAGSECECGGDVHAVYEWGRVELYGAVVDGWADRCDIRVYL